MVKASKQCLFELNVMSASQGIYVLCVRYPYKILECLPTRVHQLVLM